MKKVVPLIATAVLLLSACTSAPASVLEREARVKQQTAEFEDQVSLWEEEQEVAQESSLGEYEEARPEKIILEEMRSVIESRSIIEPDPLEGDLVHGGFGARGFIGVNPQGEAYGDGFGFNTAVDEDVSELQFILACAGTGTLQIEVLADEATIHSSQVDCDLPATQVTTNVELQQDSNYLQFVYTPSPSARGFVQYYVTY